jgi:hypothetical protein
LKVWNIRVASIIVLKRSLLKKKRGISFCMRLIILKIVIRLVTRQHKGQCFSKNSLINLAIRTSMMKLRKSSSMNLRHTSLMDEETMKIINRLYEVEPRDIPRKRQTLIDWANGSKVCARNVCAAVRMKLMNRNIKIKRKKD